MITKSKVKGLLDEQRKLSLDESYNEANIFLVLIEYELNSLLGVSHLVDYISVHIRFDLEKYLLNIQQWQTSYCRGLTMKNWNTLIKFTHKNSQIFPESSKFYRLLHENIDHT